MNSSPRAAISSVSMAPTSAGMRSRHGVALAEIQQCGAETLEIARQIVDRPVDQLGSGQSCSGRSRT